MKKWQPCTEHRVLVDPAHPDPQTGSAVSCTGSGMGQDECAVTACVARPSQLISLAVALPVPGTRLHMGVGKAPVYHCGIIGRDTARISGVSSPRTCVLKDMENPT